jgi:transposase
VKIRIGIDVACRATHQAACADETGKILWDNHRFRTIPAELERLWAKVPEGCGEVMVVIEPTRNAWVPLAAWFRRHGAVVVVVPSERSSDLRAYYAKHSKTDRLDAELLARLPLLHPDGLNPETAMGPGDPLKRAVKIRSGLVHRRTTSMHRLDSLLELLGPQWIEALGSDMTPTVFRFLTRWANPYQVKRIGKARLGRWFQRQTRKAWGDQRAAEVVAAAETTLALWGHDGLDFEALAADIAVEAFVALELNSQIKQLDDRIADLYAEADPKGILLSVPGVGDILAAQICGRLGDVSRFTSLAAARSFSGLVPRERSSGLSENAGGPTKRGDACLREALYLAADHARRVDPTLGARYRRLMCQTGRHHKSALCSVAAVLLTRIVSCLQKGVPYEIRDLDGRPITREEGKAIVAARLQIPPEIRAARRTIRQHRNNQRGRDERTKRGVAKRSKVSPVPGAS